MSCKIGPFARQTHSIGLAEWYWNQNPAMRTMLNPSNRYYVSFTFATSFPSRHVMMKATKMRLQMHDFVQNGQSLVLPCCRPWSCSDILNGHARQLMILMLALKFCDPRIGESNMNMTRHRLLHQTTVKGPAQCPVHSHSGILMNLRQHLVLWTGRWWLIASPCCGAGPQTIQSQADYPSQSEIKKILARLTSYQTRMHF